MTANDTQADDTSAGSDDINKTRYEGEESTELGASVSDLLGRMNDGGA